MRIITGYTFSAETLPPEEIDAFIWYVLSDRRPRTKEEVVTEVSRVIGFGRAVQKLAERIHSRIEYLLNTCVLENRVASDKAGNVGRSFGAKFFTRLCP